MAEKITDADIERVIEYLDNLPVKSDVWELDGRGALRKMSSKRLKQLLSEGENGSCSAPGR